MSVHDTKYTSGHQVEEEKGSSTICLFQPCGEIAPEGKAIYLTGVEGSRKAV
jgi:hypothetical protein